MKGAIAICFLALAAAALAHPHGDTYTDKWDNLNLDEILGNKPLMKAYINCCLDKGKCTPEAKEMKSHITEALETECEKCTPKQKEGTEKVIAELINHWHAEWEELTAKFDPTGKYAVKYETRLKKMKH